MVAAGVHIVPLMQSADVIAVATEAERLGYDYCLVADEGFHPMSTPAWEPSPGPPTG